MVNQKIFRFVYKKYKSAMKKITNIFSMVTKPECPKIFFF